MWFASKKRNTNSRASKRPSFHSHVTECVVVAVLVAVGEAVIAGVFVGTAFDRDKEGCGSGSGEDIR